MQKLTVSRPAGCHVCVRLRGILDVFACSAQDVSHGELTPENFTGLFYFMLVFIALGAVWIAGEQLLICCGAHKTCTLFDKLYLNYF